MNAFFTPQDMHTGNRNFSAYPCVNLQHVCGCLPVKMNLNVRRCGRAVGAACRDEESAVVSPYISSALMCQESLGCPLGSQCPAGLALRDCSASLTQM